MSEAQISIEPLPRLRDRAVARTDFSSTASPMHGSRLRGQVISRAAWPRLLPAWEDLIGRCAEDNVYYSPKYSVALAETVEKHSNVVLATVWDDTRLVALLPFVTKGPMAFPFLAAHRAWRSKFTFSCMPLFDREKADEAATVLLDLLGDVSREWIIPVVNVHGAACQALTAALERRNLPCTFLNRFSRAILKAGPTFEEHQKRHVSANRRKSLARNQRRLGELGKVEHEFHTDGPGLEEAIRAFLDIEAGGWKGRQGTALASSESTRAFALKAFTGPRSICRADILKLGGKPIAASLVAVAGQTGFAVKAAYDEAYRTYSPGLLLELELIRSFLSGTWAQQLDGATAGDHVLDEIWSEKIEVADLLFSLDPKFPGARVSALRLSEQARTAVKNGLKRLLSPLKA